MKWQQIQAADFLTLNEKRAALGYEPVAETKGNTPMTDGERKQSGIDQGTPYERVHGTEQPRAPDGKWSRINWTFIVDEEKTRLEAYVLEDPKFGESGVTVATGFDLGSKSSKFVLVLLKDHPDLAAELDRKFRPYYGLKGPEAIAACKRLGGFSLTPDQAKVLDQAMKDWMVKQVRRLYDDAIQGRGEHIMTFDELPSHAQTVLASVAFQYGPELARKAPKFWGYMIRQDWEGAVRELENFGDKFPKRRRREARLLRGIGGSSGP